MADRIAIVEDERLVRELVAVNLRHAGYEIVTAENFEQGRELLAGREYQLAILDVMLPGGDGFALTRFARDQGRGFAPESAEKLFDIHNRGSGEGVTHGAGLGLAIARQLARRMGGDIDAHSAGAGQGAVFTVTLLLAPPSAVAVQPAGAAHG